MHTSETTGAATPAEAPSPGEAPGRAPDWSSAAPFSGAPGMRSVPVDATFSVPEPMERRANGPGWGAVIGVSIVSALVAAGAAIGISSLGAVPGSGLDRQLTSIRVATAAIDRESKKLEEKLLGQGSSALSLRNDLTAIATEMRAIEGRVALFEARMAGVEEAGAKPEGATYFEVARAIGSLRARIGALEARGASLGLVRSAAVPGSAGVGTFGGAAPNAGGGPDPATLAGQLAGMDALLRAHETALAGVRGTLASSADVAAAQEELGRLVKRFEEFERGPAGPQRAAALWLVSALQAVGDSGRPFEPEFTRLAQVLPKDPDVMALADAARIGAPTLGELKSSFPKLEKAALKAWNKERPSTGLFGWLDRLIANFVTIRRVSPGSEDSARDVLSRAGRHLQRDDLSAALGEIGRLKGAARIASRDWTAKAHARAELDRHVNALRQKLARDVAGLSASAPS